MQQCGFCSALSEVFRRLLCIGGSRRGSGESYYQELNSEETRRGGISIDRSENGVFIRMLEPSTLPPGKTKRLSESDWLLLETLDTSCKRPFHTGRFLTMHKRRRKRLVTRSLTQDHALLDDIHHGQVQCVLDRINKWPFNAFILDNVTGGRSLPVLCVHLFHWYGLLDYFKLDVVRCWKFFSLIEEGYHSSNPYHNSIHATDVTQAMHCFLQEKKIREHLTPLEIMASLIAAVTHDLDHPGVNQPFLIATSNHLAALYENSSVLENHHWRSAIGCLLESHVAEELEDCRLELQRQISSLILATDINRQQEFLTRFKRYLDQDFLDMKLDEHRHFILQIALKCADISNPCRPWEVSKKWSQKVCEEFFRQGDYERQLNLPVTTFCDRQTTSVPKIQAGFFNFVVYPLFKEWHRFLGDGLSDDMMKNFHGNKIKWDALIEQENVEEAKVEILEESVDESANCASDDVDQVLDESSVKSNSTRDNFLTVPDWSMNQRVDRRHSVPLSAPGLPQGTSRTIVRRESLAIGEKKNSRVFQSGLLEEDEEESNLDLSHSLGSNSSDKSRSREDSNQENKVLSSENLLPEPSITSITTVKEASRLSVVFRKSSPQHLKIKSQLKRQQTFPPLQPYVRQRYLSTTAEMSRYTLDDANNSNSSSRSDVNAKVEFGRKGSSETSAVETPCKNGKGCRTPPNSLQIGAVLRESNTSPFQNTDHDKPNGAKRETESYVHDRGTKIAKLGDCKFVFSYEKENLDPRQGESGLDVDSFLMLGNGSARKNLTQGQLARRRGSAPVGSEVNNPTALALRGLNELYPRRGSVPADAIKCRSSEGNSCYMTQDSGLYTSQQHCHFTSPVSSFPPESGWSDKGKQKNRNKKILRRRSSGGPEMFCCGDSEGDKVKWKIETFCKRQGGEFNSHTMTTRRRGSLPIEVFLATHSGDYAETMGS